MFSTATNELRNAVERSNWGVVYDGYAIWAKNNHHRIMIGDNPISIPLPSMKRPYGFRDYLFTFMGRNDLKEVKKVEQNASKFLSKHPRKIMEDAKIFTELLPAVLENKIYQNEVKDAKINATLNNYFEGKTEEFHQSSIDFNASTQSSEIMNVIKMASECGVKSLKTPDGYEIQF